MLGKGARAAQGPEGGHSYGQRAGKHCKDTAAASSSSPCHSTLSESTRSCNALKLRPNSSTCVSIICVHWGNESPNSSTRLARSAIFGSSSSKAMRVEGRTTGAFAAWESDFAASSLLPAACPSEANSSSCFSSDHSFRLHMECRLCPRPVLFSNSKSRKQVSLSEDTWSVRACRSMRRLEFISVWKWTNGRSLSSLPKGFSSSDAAKLRENVPETCTKVMMVEKSMLPLMSVAINRGVRNMLRKSSWTMSWA
mmetsp:Transcript_23372/g.47304  ORF Transcript_23372/g.47304 Transcript_23372/m.47304 type:complete len:253 (+) Transcript_23372:87-845(+)